MPETPTLTRSLLSYVEASPTPFHAVAEARARLAAHGFTALDERDAWKLEAGARHVVVRHDSTLVAFALGSAPPAEAGFLLIGAHTDSPNLRLKPRGELNRNGFRQFAVEVYGGVLLHTWLDRDLSLAGRVFVAGEEQPRLLRMTRPLCRVPSLAIHFDREVNDRGLVLHKQNHLPPLVGLGGGDEGWLNALLSAELGVPADAIVGADLMLHDAVPPCVSGVDGEFVHAPRLDNLASCHAALEALCAAAPGRPAPTLVIALYDHEEVGSQSAEGASSAFLWSLLERIVRTTGGTAEDVHRALARSLCVSADMAHGVHPNYADLHEPQHAPKLGGGPVIKLNSNQRYATNGATALRFERAARAAGVAVQRFVMRSDLPCGSTIGPITAARLGVATVDVGNPMLSMHSIRELASSQDQAAMVAALSALFAGR
ncbi:MAG: M18 family aminopeptidase [Vicinamibacteria bacterium]|nr:M18 family aminopeptidase [Vicinamibacteria bacterium]